MTMSIGSPHRVISNTPLDYFLQIYVKDKVYVNHPQTIQTLKDNICVVASGIEPQLCEKNMQNFLNRKIIFDRHYCIIEKFNLSLETKMLRI